MSPLLRTIMVGMRLLAKPHLQALHDPAKARANFAHAARHGFNIPPYSLFLSEEFVSDNKTRPALWVSCGKVRPRQVILYLHGGGFVVGSPETHRTMTARLSRLTGLRVFSPSYRLAPENPYPAALRDAEAAFQVLENKGYHPSDIVIGGDSAGGSLALALVAKLCQSGRIPAGCFVFSPWTDLTLSGASLHENKQNDPLLPASRIEELRDYYTAGADPTDPGISPLFADYSGCSPVFIQFSATEILRDDCLRMGEHLKAQGVSVTLDQWPDAPHVWHLFDGWLEESHVALQTTADFITQVLCSRAEKGEN